MPFSCSFLAVTRVTRNAKTLYHHLARESRVLSCDGLPGPARHTNPLVWRVLISNLSRLYLHTVRAFEVFSDQSIYVRSMTQIWRTDQASSSLKLPSPCSSLVPLDARRLPDTIRHGNKVLRFLCRSRRNTSNEFLLSIGLRPQMHRLSAFCMKHGP